LLSKTVSSPPQGEDLDHGDIDLDGDGDLDIISIGWYKSKIWVYENR